LRLNSDFLGSGKAVDWRTRIVSDPDILLGKPTIKGTRIAVEFVIGCFAGGWSLAQILESYQQVSREDVLAALAYARHAASARQLVDGLPGQEESLDDILVGLTAVRPNTPAGGSGGRSQ
jgi:uncharacterized protein (DUF433 family)